MNPTGLVQGHRHDRRALRRCRTRLRVGGLRLHRQHLRSDGGLMLPRAGLRSIVFIPEGKIALGQALAVDGLRRALTIQLKTDFDGCVDLLDGACPALPDLPTFNSVNPYRLEGQEHPSSSRCWSRWIWQVPEHVIVPGGNLANSSALRQGLPRTAAPRHDYKRAQDQHHPQA